MTAVSARSPMLVTRRRTGNTRARAPMSAGSSKSRFCSSRWTRCRLSASITLSTALYGTDSRSYARPRSTSASPRSASPSRKCCATADLPMPDAPPTRTVTERPERTCSNPSRSAASCGSRPTSADDAPRIHAGQRRRGRPEASVVLRGASGSRARSAASRRRDRGARGRASRGRAGTPSTHRRAAPDRAAPSS